MHPITPSPSRARQIADELREQIRRRFHAGEILPPQRDLAARHQANRHTIHRALELLATEGWIQRTATGRYECRAPLQVPGQVSGLFFPFSSVSLLSMPFTSEVFNGLMSAASQRGRHLLTFFGGVDSLRLLGRDAFWSTDMRAVDSLLTLELFDEQIIRRATRLFPVVCLDAEMRLPNCSSVRFDHDASVRMAVKYLVDLGHRRIGFLGRTASSDPADAARFRAYQAAIRWLDIPVDDRLVLTGGLGDLRDAIGPFLRGLPADHRPTAFVVCTNFWIAYLGLLRAGLRVPRDISLIDINTPTYWHDFVAYNFERLGQEEFKPVREYAGFSESELFNARPTTVVQPAFQMGQWGLLELCRRLQDPSSPPQHCMLPPTLLAGTTATPASR